MHSAMQAFAFETVTVDPSGAMTARRRCVATQFVEALADDVTLEMVAIPGGVFQMGSPPGQGFADEHPRHKVSIATPRPTSGVFPPMHMACMTCMGTCGSGVPTVGMTTMRRHQRTVGRGGLVVSLAFCAAAAGTIRPICAAARPACAMSHARVTTSSVCAWR